MDPSKIPFNALIVGPPNSGKTQHLVNQLHGPFGGKFDYIVLLCPTFVHNKTFDGFVDKEPNIFVVACQHNEVESLLKLASVFFEGTNMLIILDDCAASKDVNSKGARAIWSPLASAPVTLDSAKPFHENVMNIVLSYTPSSKTTKAIFEDYVGELFFEEWKEFITQLKMIRFSHLVFSLRYYSGSKLIFGVSEKMRNSVTQ